MLHSFRVQSVQMRAFPFTLGMSVSVVLAQFVTEASYQAISLFPTAVSNCFEYFTFNPICRKDTSGFKFCVFFFSISNKRLSYQKSNVSKK